MKLFDERLEFLFALVLAVKKNCKCMNDELDFVEDINSNYLNDLVKSISIEKYPLLKEMILDMEDCGYYANLFLYFDENFNLDSSCTLSVFKNYSNIEFANLVKEIYDNEMISTVFLKYKEYLENIEDSFTNKYHLEYKNELSRIFNQETNVRFTMKISFLINGGFSCHNEKEVCYVRGITLDKENQVIKNDYVIVCMYHEYAHYFVNPFVNQYIELLHKCSSIYKEAIKNGLPKTYQNENTFYYEYFVRALSIYLSEDKISMENKEKYIVSFIEMGFIYIKDIIQIIEEELESKKTFQEIFINDILPYFEKCTKHLI